MGDYLRSLGVNLFCLSYFKEGQPVCDEDDYLKVRAFHPNIFLFMCTALYVEASCSITCPAPARVSGGGATAAAHCGCPAWPSGELIPLEGLALLLTCFAVF